MSVGRPRAPAEWTAAWSLRQCGGFPSQIHIAAAVVRCYACASEALLCLSARAQYLDAQLRTTVVSWLVKVGLEYEMHQESVFLAIALLDRYLAATEVQSDLVESLLHLFAMSCRGPEAHEPASLIDPARSIHTLQASACWLLLWHVTWLSS